METVKLLLFERPTAIYVALFFGEMICLLVLWRLRSRAAGIVAAIPLALGAIVFVLSAAITTEHERLVSAVQAMREAVMNRDANAIAALVDDSYYDQRYDRQRLALAAVEGANGLGIRSIELPNLLEAQMNEDTAYISSLKIDVLWGKSPQEHNRNRFEWQLWWVRRSDGWRLTSSRLVDPGDLYAAPKGPR